MVALAVVVVVILDKDGLVGKVSCESDGRYAETRESTLEAVPAREWAGISPGLTVRNWSILMAYEIGGEVMRRTIWPMDPLLQGRRRQQTSEGRNR